MKCTTGINFVSEVSFDYTLLFHSPKKLTNSITIVSKELFTFLYKNLGIFSLYFFLVHFSKFLALPMSLIHLNTLDQLPQDWQYLIYKHSNCPISSRAKGTLKKFLDTSSVDVYELHVVDQRPLSNQITEIYGIQHESPQVLIIHNGIVKAWESHFGIQHNWLEENV